MNSAHRTSAPRLFALAGLTAALLCTHAAHAQAVHKCRVDGRLVYQASPCPLEPQAGATATPLAAASIGSPSAPKKKTLAELLRERERDGAEPAVPVSRDAQGDGANILRTRMGAV